MKTKITLGNSVSILVGSSVWNSIYLNQPTATGVNNSECSSHVWSSVNDSVWKSVMSEIYNSVYSPLSGSMWNSINNSISV